MIIACAQPFFCPTIAHSKIYGFGKCETNLCQLPQCVKMLDRYGAQYHHQK